MYCEKCGTKLEKGAKFCSQCGSAINPSIVATTTHIVKEEPQKKKPWIVSFIQKVALWFYIILLATWCLTYFPSIYSVIFFICFALVLPIKQWDRIIPKRSLRVLIAVALTFFAIIIIPTCDHEYVEISKKEPTESANGELVQECSICGDRTVTVLQKTGIKESESKNNPSNSEPLLFLDDFSQYGYTSEEIKAIKTILTNVGITEVTELEISDVSYGMQTVKGIAYKDTSLGGYKEVQVRFNIENGVIYLVHIYCPNGTPYLSGLTDRGADLYYDAAGGYLKKIDWQNKKIIDYHPSTVETYSNGEVIIGSDKQCPYVLTVEDFYEELSKDFQSASQKYSGKWIKITGKITDTSDAGGYYIYGKKTTTGYNDMRIICRCIDSSYSSIAVGNTKTFLGFIKNITKGDPIEIGGCEIVK